MGDEQKKAVVRTLVSCLEQSPVAKAIDTKAFVMIAHNSYDSMRTDHGIDLEPLWLQLSPGSDVPPELGALFFRYEAELSKLRLEVTLPAALDALPPEMKRMLGNRARPKADPAGMSELHGQILVSLVTAIRASPAGAKVATGQLQATISSDYEAVFDGKRFDFAPVLDWLLGQPGVSEADVYPAIVKFKKMVAERGVLMVEPKLKLTASERQKALAASADHDHKKPPAPGAAAAAPAIEKPQAKLPEKGRKIALVVVLVLVLVGGAAAAWFTRPRKAVDIAALQAIFPVVSAEIAPGGRLVGRLDEGAWKGMPKEKRSDAVKALESALRDKGYLKSGVTIMDSSRRWIVFDLKGEKLTMEDG
ncbi:MAG: hypothetical protein HYV07_10370 [Deltaproteobacteria bacterium]|nr:hypothetical protein [Deltaproteobacteria bacterium]